MTKLEFKNKQTILRIKFDFYFPITFTQYI